jgi:asparagine N-glycosylation enzyme membrane subunit Stt3
MVKFLENLSVVILIGVWAALSTWAIVQGFLESKSLFFSVSISVLWLAFLVLLLSAAFKRYKESKNDTYKDVEI